MLLLSKRLVTFRYSRGNQISKLSKVCKVLSFLYMYFDHMSLGLFRFSGSPSTSLTLTLTLIIENDNQVSHKGGGRNRDRRLTNQKSIKLNLI